jgi:hypothetical protein
MIRTSPTASGAPSHTSSETPSRAHCPAVTSAVLLTKLELSNRVRVALLVHDAELV